MTLDGVVQSPAHPTRTMRAGVVHGGWTAPHFERPARAQALLPCLLAGDTE
jgi:hypothetical protein